MAELSELGGLLAGLQGADFDTRKQIAAKIGEIGPAAIPDLIAALGIGDVNARIGAAWALGNIGDTAITALIDALGDKDLRTNATFAFCYIDSPAATASLLNILDDDNADVRAWAHVALGARGDASNVPAMLAGLRDQNNQVRRSTAFALGWIGHPSAAPGFVEALNDEDRFVRFYAARGLYRVGGDQMAIPKLVKALHDENSGVRYEASAALKKLGWQPTNDAERASYLVAAVDWEACVRLGAAAVPDLVQALRHERKWVRQVIADGATEVTIADPYFIEASVSAPAVMYHGLIETLRKIGDPRAIPALIECLAYTERTHFWGGRICSLAAGALQVIGTPEALAALKQWENGQPGD